MSKTVFKLNISNDLISPYYKVFGHFFLDHLFQLYKIKEWYNKKNNTNIDSILIEQRLLNIAPFIEKFYKTLFNIHIINKKNNNFNIIDLGIIIGSKIGSENNIIYLSKSKININIPENIIENGRKLTKNNKIMLNNMIGEIKEKLNINNNSIQIKKKKHILIINRKKEPRKLINLDKLINRLRQIGYICNTVCFDNMELYEQIILISSYKNIITACGSVQVHICFMNNDCNYIELCESGFRYPNTSIYGFLCNKKTYSICSPLENNKKLNRIRNQNNNTKVLFKIGSSLPNIIFNNPRDIKREKSFYSKLISYNCFSIHMIQNINCLKYIDIIIKLLN